MDQSHSHLSLNLNSSMPKAASDCVDDEESGWTSYFEDLPSSSNTTTFSSSSSFLSDAASCVASNNPLLPSNIHILTFMNTTIPHHISHYSHLDDPLEDTATSPLSSPKVAELNPRTNESESDEMISRKTTDQLYDSMDKGFTSEPDLELQIRDGDEDDEHNKDKMTYT